MPLTVPRSIQPDDSVCAAFARTNVIGFSAPRFANSRMSAGCGMIAMLGGFPPCTAVPSTVGRFRAAEVNLTFTFG